jgi:pimeloyl-ACP methyl ester carboxylesterase
VHALMIVLAVASVFALATWAHYAFWTRRFALPGGEDETVFAETTDGWRLALARRLPRGARRALPVILCHGSAVNRGAMDFGLERWSLAAHLAAAGFECFAIDLRGHGTSHPARADAPTAWNFDDYVLRDVPAALDAVRAATGHDRVLWVGHSQGGLIGMAACELYPERIAGLVALGSPAFFASQDVLRLFVRFGFLLTGRLNRFAARCLAPFSGWWHPPVAEIAINGRNVERHVYRRILANVVENISPGVMREVGRWATSDAFASEDGSVDYRATLAQCRQPALFVAADGDLIAPPSIVERAAQAWGGTADVLRIGLASSACCDYGHSDLIFGRRAPEEVFPAIAAWLERQAPAAGTAEQRQGAESPAPLPMRGRGSGRGGP